MSQESNSDEKTTRRLSLLNDLYVDLLSSLVPGLFTVILGCLVLALTSSAVFKCLYPSSTMVDSKDGAAQRPVERSDRVSGGENNEDSSSPATSLIGDYHYELALITLVSAYVVGVIFFRQDPRKPDENSAVLAWMTAKPDERPGLAVQGTAKDAGSAAYGLWQRIHASVRPRAFLETLEMDAKFPYLYLRCYLHARGLTHLERYVPWCPRQGWTHGNRTKMFLNAFKIRLQLIAPSSCWDIVRNEAQVRLATSVWYSAATLAALSAFSLFALTIAIALVKQPAMDSLQVAYAPMVTSGLVLALCLASRSRLRKCIHYMRVREVVYVLETIHMVGKRNLSLCVGELTAKGQKVNCADCEAEGSKPAKKA